MAQINKPWGYEIILTETGLPYVGKILHIEVGKRLSLQIHDAKKETSCLINGRCNLIIENEIGELETLEMEKQKGYTININQKHRYLAITDCDVYEVSTPEIGITYRLEDDYARPNETEEIRKEERKQS